MKDLSVLARCNLFAVLGAIPQLLELDPASAALVAKKRIKIGFSVKDCAEATLAIDHGHALLTPGTKGCSIKLYFSSPEKFNTMIDGTGNPLPVSGFQHLPFLLGGFSKLTDRLSMYLRPTPERLEDPEFFRVSTTLMLYVIGRAIVQIGNHDAVGRHSASYITDGKIKLGIGDDLAVAIHAREHHLMFNPIPHSENVTSEMVFADLSVARDLFDGRINAIAAVGLGQVRVGGMISQVDNINRILDRVSLYLA